MTIHWLLCVVFKMKSLSFTIVISTIEISPTTVDRALLVQCGSPSPACKNNKLIDKFKHVGPNPDGSWDYYADKNKKQALSLDQIAMFPEMKGCHFFTTHH